MSFDFDAAVIAPFRMQPGLRRIAAGTPHLTPLSPGSRHQREKLAVLSTFAHQALVQRPGFAAAPALAALSAHAAAEHPEAWAIQGGAAQARHLGTAVEDGEVRELQAGSFGLGDEIARCLRPLAPEWRLAGLLSLAFAEDFAIVDARDATVPWMAVALPSHWAPEDKVGRHFTEVHAPVPDNAALLRAGEALMRTAAGPERLERFVWNVTDHPHLHAHPLRTARERWSEFSPAQAWWRTERQTFIPMPRLGQAVFTIRVDLEPLLSAMQPAGRATRLHAAIASMSPAVLAYRGLTPVREPLLHWLAAQTRA